MNTKPTSIFHVKGIFLEKADVDKKVDKWTPDSPDGIGGFGMSILKILARYTLLNKACILKCAQSINPSQWKVSKISTTLRALRKAKMIHMYQMEGSATDEASLIVYCLSEKAEALLQEKNIAYSENITIKELLNYTGLTTEEEKEVATYTCTRLLALNQWHINMLYNMGDRTICNFYKSFKIEDITIPSVITYRPMRANTKKAGKISLFTFFAPNNDEKMELLANELVKTYNFLSSPQHKKYRPSIIIVLCENTNHSAWVSWKFSQFRQLRQIDSALYAIDIGTSKERMLALLNECRANELGIMRTGINLE